MGGLCPKKAEPEDETNYDLKKPMLPTPQDNT